METGSTGALARRTLVVGGAAGAATAALAGTADAAAPRRAPGRRRWEALVGTTFTSTLGGRRVRLRLERVEDGGTRPRGLSKRRLAEWRAETFRLVFSTRQGLEQGTWTLRHPRTGRIRVFLVPGGDVPGRGRRGRAGGGRASASAVFNGWKG